MIRLRLSLHDVARTTLAAPSPYCELPVSAQVIQQPASSFRRLFAKSELRLPPSAIHLLELVPAHGNVPDFLAPDGATDLAEALETVVSAPGTLVRNDVAMGGRRRPSPFIRDLMDGRVSARTALASSFRDFYDVVLGPLWPVVDHVLDADRRFRASQVATKGIAATVAELHPGIRWLDGLVEIDGPLDGEVDLAGRGLQIRPTLLTRPAFTDRFVQPTLFYPVSRLAWTCPAPARGPRDPLAALLGTTRARALRALADPHTTSGLANALGISPASASAHTTVLRNAGLVTSRRHGQSVYHTLTERGAEVVSGY